MTDRMLPSGVPRTLHIADLSRNEYVQGKDDREPTVDLDQANVVSSLQSGTEPGSRAQHYPVLDLDLPAVLVPSSTPGHSHLYIDLPIPDDTYWRLCDALVDAGVLQEGYVSACKSRGYTSVRLPWVRKEAAS